MVIFNIIRCCGAWYDKVWYGPYAKAKMVRHGTEIHAFCLDLNIYIFIRLHGYLTSIYTSFWLRNVVSVSWFWVFLSWTWSSRSFVVRSFTSFLHSAASSVIRFWSDEVESSRALLRSKSFWTFTEANIDHSLVVRNNYKIPTALRYVTMLKQTHTALWYITVPLQTKIWVVCNESSNWLKVITLATGNTNSSIINFLKPTICW